MFSAFSLRFVSNCFDHSRDFPSSLKQVFSDAYAEREVLALEVLCSAVTSGCSWGGKLGDLEEHMLTCPYVSVECGQNGCSEKIQRGLLAQHQQQVCVYRFVPCQHCEASIVYHTFKVCSRAGIHWGSIGACPPPHPRNNSYFKTIQNLLLQVLK